MNLSTNLILIFLIFLSLASVENAVPVSNDLTIPAQEILDKIKYGETIYYNDVIIDGDLELMENDIKTSNSINSDITIENSKILGKLDFNNRTFTKPFSLMGTSVFGPSRFINIRFRKDAIFEKSEFIEPSSFGEVEFDGYTNFDEAIFNQSANFWRSNFTQGMIGFRRTQFNGPTSFIQSRFDGDSSFGEAIFRKSASFYRSIFNGIAEFSGTHFYDSADFRSTEFKLPANFIGARFDKTVNFVNSKFQSILLNWETIDKKLVPNGQVYQQFIKNFKDLEQFEDADSCYYQYRNWMRENRQHLDTTKIFDYVAWLSCGYGIQWHKPILSGIFIIFFFGIYYFLTDAIFKLSNIHTRIHYFASGGIIDKLMRSFAYSAVVLLSLPAEWYPYEKEDYFASLRFHFYSSIIERLTGYALMLLFIGTLTRLMVRY